MKKLLLLCAMSTIATNLYGAAYGYRYEGGEVMRPGGLSSAAAGQKAKELVAQYGPNLDAIHVKGLTNQLWRALNLGDAAVDPKDLVIARIQTANRIYTANPGGYNSLNSFFKDMIQRISLADWNELERMNAELDAQGK